MKNFILYYYNLEITDYISQDTYYYIETKTDIYYFCKVRKSEEELDKIYEELSTEMNEEKRKEMIQKLQQILIDDAAVMVHGYYNSNMCSDKSVDGAQISVADYYWISTDIKPAK